MSDDRTPRQSGGDRSDRGPDESDTPLSQGEVFDLLSSPRRRRLVRYLLLNGGAVTSDDLVDAVSMLETQADSTRADSDRSEAANRKSVYVSLRQTHLPRLADAGVIDYDRDADRVRPTERLSLLAAPLRAVDELSPPESGTELSLHDSRDIADDVAGED